MLKPVCSPSEISILDRNVSLFWHVGYDSHSEYPGFPDKKHIGALVLQKQGWKQATDWMN